MKPGLKHWLEIRLVGMDKYWDEIQQIEILFKQDMGNSSIQKRVLWPGCDTTDCRRGNGDILLILWTREETYQFKENEAFLMDVRPTLKNGLDLNVEPVKLRMTWTLFKDEEE